MPPMFFATQNNFRDWLTINHDKEKELIVGFYKVNSGMPSLTWSESVDQALCFGWIDGIRRSIDDKSYSIRFTPRNPKSIWSAVNINKIDELIKKGQMMSSGLVAFEKREEHKSKIYAYENEPVELDSDYEKKFKSHIKSWTFFKSQAPSYQKRINSWIMSAKQEKTKQARLDKVIKMSESQERI